MAIFLLVLTIAGFSVYGIERVEADRLRQQLHAVAVGVGAALERRAVSHVTYLRAGAMLLSASPRLNAQEYHELSASMADDDENHGIAGITWAPQIAISDIAAFVAARRAEGLTGYSVYPLPAEHGDFVVPVTYTSNTGVGPNVALGFDMASEPQRRAAMLQSVRDRRPTASGRVTLIRHGPGTNGSGFVIYMPVYSRAINGGRLIGFVCTSFNAQAFLDAALATVPTRGFGVHLYDASAGANLGPDRLMADVPGPRDPDITFSQSLKIANRPLVLVIDARGRGTLSPLSALTLLFALLVAVLLTVLARVVTRHAEEDRASLDWLEEQVSIRNTLTRELNHRVKNTLANVLSIIALTRRRATRLDEFADSLTGRIMALSATHDVLTGLGWGPAPLRAVIAAELAPYTEGRDHVISVSGPEVALAPNDALSLGLAVHELATNASKYGALSVLSGQVDVSWNLMTPELAQVVWQERGGPPVASERRRGFGTDLIEKIVAHELGNGVDLRFDPAGVRCMLIVPVRLPATFRIRAPK